MQILERFKLDGNVAVVTGCRRGIGKAIALALAEAGADIIGVSASLEKAGSQVEREVRMRGRQFRGYNCDFSDRKALYRFLEDDAPLSIEGCFREDILQFPYISRPVVPDEQTVSPFLHGPHVLAQLAVDLFQ